MKAPGLCMYVCICVCELDLFGADVICTMQQQQRKGIPCQKGTWVVFIVAQMKDVVLLRRVLLMVPRGLSIYR
jgi:hypothetical protein